MTLNEYCTSKKCDVCPLYKDGCKRYDNDFWSNELFVCADRLSLTDHEVRRLKILLTKAEKIHSEAVKYWEKLKEVKE